MQLSRAAHGRVVVSILVAAVVVIIIYRLVYFTHNTNLTTSQATSSPVIGILSIPVSLTDCHPAPHSKQTGCINVNYVNWLQQAGTRVVPIPWDASTRDIDFLLKSVNGVLFTGACFDIALDMPYVRSASHVYERVIQMNNAGDVFPLWGNCIGMELLTVLAAAKNTSVLCRKCYDAENVSLPLNFTSDALSSSLFRNAPERLLTTLTRDWITLNIHHDGVPPEMYTQNPQLKKVFKVISTSRDRKGQTFTSTIEGCQYPFWGLQWHPERPQLQPDGSATSPTYAMQYFANFFVNQARRSRHKFFSAEVEQKYLASTYHPQTVKGKTYYYTTSGLHTA